MHGRVACEPSAETAGPPLTQPSRTRGLRCCSRRDRAVLAILLPSISPQAAARRSAKAQPACRKRRAALPRQQARPSAGVAGRRQRPRLAQRQPSVPARMIPAGASLRKSAISNAPLPARFRRSKSTGTTGSALTSTSTASPSDTMPDGISVPHRLTFPTVVLLPCVGRRAPTAGEGACIV